MKINDSNTLFAPLNGKPAHQSSEACVRHGNEGQTEENF